MEWCNFLILNGLTCRFIIMLILVLKKYHKENSCVQPYGKMARGDINIYKHKRT